MFENTSKRFSEIFKKLSGNSKITERNVEEAVEEIKNALLDADVNLRVLRRFVNSTLEEAKGEKVLKSINPREQFIKIVNDKIIAMLKGDDEPNLKLKGPDVVSTIVLMGLQGNGKTTTAGKLAYKLKKDGKRPLLVAADLKRAAAITQLKIVGEEAGVPVFANENTDDVVSVVNDALAFAKKNQYNVMIVDTAGRLSLDDELMDELSRITSSVHPDEKLFVSDASLGQEAANIVKVFDEKVGITGVILTKFDSDTKGGAALSIASVTHRSIKFVGVGEKKEDLEQFYPERAASRILGMGDVVSLVEKAESVINEEEAEKLQKRLESSTFSIADYLMQLESVNKMGGAKKLISMIPGMSAVDTDALNLDDFKKEKAIIYSMTKKERDNYRLIGPPRRKRIAKGAGVSVSDVDRFIRKFEKIKLTMKKVTKNKKIQAALLEKFGMLG